MHLDRFNPRIWSTDIVNESDFLMEPTVRIPLSEDPLSRQYMCSGMIDLQFAGSQNDASTTKSKMHSQHGKPAGKQKIPGTLAAFNPEWHPRYHLKNVKHGKTQHKEPRPPKQCCNANNIEQLLIFTQMSQES